MGDFVQLPVHDVRLAAGIGVWNDTEAVVDHLSFRKGWLKREAIKVTAARIGQASGGSMEPTIWDGDPVLIDISRNQVPTRTPASKGRGPIFALLHGNEARIKRVLRYDDGAMILVSDNPEFPPEPVRFSDMEIIGRIVWWGHTNRE